MISVIVLVDFLEIYLPKQYTEAHRLYTAIMKYSARKFIFTQLFYFIGIFVFNLLVETCHLLFWFMSPGQTVLFVMWSSLERPYFN